MNVIIEEKAERLLSNANCYSAPVKVEQCAKYLNIELESLELDANISGFLLLKDKSVHIGYNQNNSKKRQRFTIAHEIGHYLLHDRSSTLFIDKSKEVFFRDVNSSTGDLVQEREANAFAASLLMPKKLLIEELKKINIKDKETITKQLSKTFNVSEQAITIRLNSLGMIDYDAFAS